MPLGNRLYCTCLLLGCLFSITARSQSAVTDSSLVIPVREYHNYLRPESALYRGPQYVVYAFELKDGHPYFDQNEMQQGSLVYNGILYKDVSLILDLVKETLVTNDTRKIYKIALIGEEIDSFTIQDHIFIHYKDSINAPFRPGFYERLHNGPLTILKKEKKTIRPEIEFQVLNKYVDYSVSYYLKKNNTWYPVNSEKSLLRAFGPDASALKKFLRNNKLKFKQDKDNTLLRSAAWYETQHLTGFQSGAVRQTYSRFGPGGQISITRMGHNPGFQSGAVRQTYSRFGPGGQISLTRVGHNQ